MTGHVRSAMTGRSPESNPLWLHEIAHVIVHHHDRMQSLSQIFGDLWFFGIRCPNFLETISNFYQTLHM
jgi:hypothetical protein